MKRWLASVVMFGLLPPGLHSALQSAEAPDEQQLIDILQSNRPPQDKDAACARLKRIGTARAVPALAALLADEPLSHSARYALESMAAPEAGQALIDVLDKTLGLTKIGLIGSLGVREDTRAVPALTKLLADADIRIASAAATALGQIGGPDAIKALERSLSAATDPLHATVADAVLACAHQMLASGDRSNARAVFQRLYDSEKKEALRQAAFLGMILASDDRSVALITGAIAGKDGASQAAALQCVRDINDPTATKAIADLLPKVKPVVQVALIEGLAQRGDLSACPAIAAMVGTSEPAVRLSAVRALGILGEASHVRLLAETAASSKGDLQRAARQSLVQLHWGQVTEALLWPLPSASPAVQAELSKALGERADTIALPRLLELAGTGPDAARVAACGALALLAGKAEIGPMVRLVMEAKTDPVRNAASQALSSVCRRLQSRLADLDVGPIVRGLQSGQPAARVALLPICSSVIDPRTRNALVKASADPDPAIRAAAVRAACETRDPELLPHLLKIAGTDGDAGLRVLAIRRSVRLTTQDEPRLSIQQRLDALKALLDCSARTEERRLILSGLAEISDPQALDLIVPLLDSAEVRNEASLAAVKVAGAVAGSRTGPAADAMKKVLAVSTDPGARQAADRVLRQIEATSGFVTAWQVAGPYRQAGKDYAALFDIAFAPEGPAPQDVVWRPLPAGTDAAKPWLLDLLKALGGEQCVAYARTRLHGDQEQPARLEIGSDDGLKVWLDGRLVHANNTARPLTPGTDKVNVTFKPGWNTLLLKVTQNNLPWEFCMRIVGPDGSPLEGLAVDASPGKEGGNSPLVASAQQAVPSPDQFLRHRLDAAFRSEGVAVADFNRDGHPDIATGNILYLGPDWRPQPMVDPPQEYKPEAYSDMFYCFAEDVNRDGWIDLIVVGFPGAQTSWLQNPGQAGGPWPRHPAIDKTGNESPDWMDVDKDGRKELVFVSDQGMAFAQPGPDPTRPWPIRVIAGPKDPRPPHGLGIGDINGDGRSDVLCPEGWWEAPADQGRVPWTFHPATLGQASAQMCVYDVSGDGCADVLSSSAHGYGLWWCEQTADGWTMHEIDHSISQLHALHLADINGDGLPDMVTGKRFWAHRQGDPGVDEPAMLCWYELQRRDGQVAWLRHDIDQDSGVGLHFQIVDLNGDGLLDIVTSNKKGVFTFTHSRRGAG